MGRSTLSDSSDSADEPIDPARRDPDVRYLTSRATSPMDPAERDVFIAADKTSQAAKGKVRNRLLARTKTKKYPVGDRKRRRQLKDVSIQVNIFVFVFVLVIVNDVTLLRLGRWILNVDWLINRLTGWLTN